MKVRVFGIIAVALFLVCVSSSFCVAQKVPPGIFNSGKLNEGEEKELKKPPPPPPTPAKDLGKPPVLDPKPPQDTIGPAPKDTSPVDTGKDRLKR